MQHKLRARCHAPCMHDPSRCASWLGPCAPLRARPVPRAPGLGSPCPRRARCCPAQHQLGCPAQQGRRQQPCPPPQRAAHPRRPWPRRPRRRPQRCRPPSPSPAARPRCQQVPGRQGSAVGGPQCQHGCAPPAECMLASRSPAFEPGTCRCRLSAAGPCPQRPVAHHFDVVRRIHGAWAWGEVLGRPAQGGAAQQEHEVGARATAAAWPSPAAMRRQWRGGIDSGHAAASPGRGRCAPGEGMARSGGENDLGAGKSGKGKCQRREKGFGGNAAQMRWTAAGGATLPARLLHRRRSSAAAV